MMASDNSNNGNNNNNPPNDMNRQHRRGSVTSAAFTSLFRSNSTSQGVGFPGPITSAAMNDRRRLSVSTLGLSGSSPNSASAPFMRRASLSTNNSDSIDENAVEEEDGSRTAPTTPFTRRMSFGAQATMRNMRPGGGSPGTNGMPSPILRRRSTAAVPRSPPPPDPYSQASKANGPSAASNSYSPRAARSDQGFNWSEQLRSRAESTVAGSRQPFAFGQGTSASPPRGNPGGGGSPPGNTYHDRSKSVSDMPAPPAQTPRPRQPQKPDHFQERILKGDFYMD
jgi:hypothetical protein